MKRTWILATSAVVLMAVACTGAASPSVAEPEPSTEASPQPSTAASPEQSPSALGDIVATATEAGSFATLLKAATAAGLVETLQGDGPYTVFAPTDDAFAALPAGTLDSLLADPAALKQILLYHVVAGKVTADQVVKLTSADSVAGQPIGIKVNDGSVYLNDTAKVVAADVLASNGVIHVIDHVILPPSS